MLKASCKTTNIPWYTPEHCLSNNNDFNNGYHTSIISNHPDVKQSRYGFVDKLEKRLVGQQVYVGSSSDETVHIFRGVNVKMNVYPVHYLIAEYWVDHVSLHLADCVAAFIVLDPGWMPSHVTVLTAAEKNHLLEVPQMPLFA